MEKSSERLARRTWLGGAASVGAMVAGVVAMRPRLPVEAVAAGSGKAAADTIPNTGYQVTEHVKRYYATARV
ncbi:MAG: formate dehydrogenase [Rhodoferax sp.]